MGVRALEAATLSLSLLLLPFATGLAQTPASSPAPLPTPGFMPPYEIVNIARSAGFEPLAPPLREGATYVLRATDFRGILMRVVVDAHSGAIRAVNRIVPGPGSYGPIGMAPPPYGPPFGVAPPYPVPPPYQGLDFESAAAISSQGATPAAEPMLPAAPAGGAASRSTLAAIPPLPRPRPTALSSHDTGSDIKSGAADAVKSDAKSDAANAAPAARPGPSAAPLSPNQAPAAAPLND